MFENAVVRSPLLQDGGTVSADDANTTSCVTKHILDVSRFELPAELKLHPTLPNTTKAEITQHKQHDRTHEEEKQIRHINLRAEGTQNQVC